VTGHLLEIEDVACAREGRRLFEHLDLVLREGECVELTGPNGSGKSTLLRCICGLYPDYEGRIDAASIAYLGHRPAVSGLLTPLENLRWFAALGAGPAATAYAPLEGVLDRVGLGGYEDVRCQYLSAGQQRRVALARLSISRGLLWLLDEPFTALDIAGQALVRRLLARHLEAGGAAICATHQPLQLAGARRLELGAVA
jgi:heme exporter protein A